LRLHDAGQRYEFACFGITNGLILFPAGNQPSGAKARIVYCSMWHNSCRAFPNLFPDLNNGDDRQMTLR
jgi:hypothetical protein